jgi:lambda family phage portal protein
MQTLATRTWFDAGEAFIRRRARSDTFGTRLPLQIQIIEPDFCPLIDFDAEPRMPVGNTVRMGIERDKRGQRVAFWFYREHPGDKPSGTIQTQQLLRIPASDVIHVFEPSRPGQLRGVSNAAPVLTRLRTIGAYDDNVMTRMQLANLMVGFIKSDLPNGPDDGTNPLTGLPYDTLGTEPLAKLEPGIMQELDPGQEVQWSNPPEAGTDYTPYMRTQHMGTASGVGLPYELFSGDIANVSDRTLRVVMQEFRRFAEQRQWQIIIPQMCQRVVEWFAEAALLVGEISAAELDDVRRVEHSPHGWQYLHPVQDVQGKQLEVEAGFRSRSSVISERGDDPEATDLERQSDDQREERLGIKPDPAAAAQQQADQQAQQQQQAQALLDEIASIRARADALQASIAAQQPNINVVVDGAAVHAPSDEDIALKGRIVDLLERRRG